MMKTAALDAFLNLEVASDTGSVDDKAVDLFLKSGYLDYSYSELLSINTRTLKELLRCRLRNDFLKEKPAQKHDPKDYSFCYINLRACYDDGSTHGRIINAVKLLFGLRENAVHLGPFYEDFFSQIYLVRSHRIIDPLLTDPNLLHEGFSARNQLQFFCEAAHLLGKAVGIDLEPHTVAYSRIVLDYPQLFRWIRLDMEKKSVYSEAQIGLDDFQSRMTDDIHKLLSGFKENRKILRFDDNQTPVEDIYRATLLLNDNGFYNLPLNPWNGFGLPEYAHYHEAGKYPEFHYRDRYGNPSAEPTIGTLTPFRWYNYSEGKMSINTQTLQYLTGYCKRHLEEFSIDFIRLDYADHLFDSTDRDGLPLSDRMTPFFLESLIAQFRKLDPSLFFLVERLELDLENYRNTGTDLLYSYEYQNEMTLEFAQYSIQQQLQIAESNRTAGKKITAIMALDTHDSVMQIVDRFGKRSHRIKLFFMLFGSAGEGRRPPYLVMGNSDGTTGIQKSIITEFHPDWKNDREMLKFYHRVYDIYDKYRPLFLNGTIENEEVRNNSLIWTLIGPGHEVLIMMINWGNEPEIVDVFFENALVCNPELPQDYCLKQSLYTLLPGSMAILKMENTNQVSSPG